MAGWDQVLSDEQIAAVLTLIQEWDTVPTGAIPEPDVPVPVTAESIALGSELFTANCSRCHGPEGQGTQRAPALNVSGYLAETSDLALEQIITLGVPDTAMPAWGDRMSEAEIQAIVGFIRAWEPTAPEVAEAARTGGPWWQTGSSSPVGQSVATAGRTRGGGPWWATEGGAPPGQSGQTGVAADQTTAQAQGVTDVPLDATGVMTSTTHTHEDGSTGGPPEWAGQGQGTQAVDGQIDAATTTHTHDGTTSGPPWAAETLPTSWWAGLDSRAQFIVFWAAAFGLGLIVTGAVGTWVVTRKARQQPPELAAS